MTWLLIMPGTMSANAQISPGPLAHAHHMLNGSTHCIDCHDIAKTNSQFKCLECHRDIREGLQENRGLHPSLVGADRTSKGCVRCHSDHNGLEFALVHWDAPVNRFDHHRAGYALEGKHAQLACRECHQAQRISTAARETISVKDLDRTFLGLSPRCLGCHVDEHRGQLSAECSNCHDALRWKNAAQFVHKRARFNLAGGHDKVACEKCHIPVEDAKPYVKYKGIPFEDCTPCHRDPHKGAFKAGCRSCHLSAFSWKPSQMTAVFNHFQTRYSLEGKHSNVACDSCHRKADFKEPVPFARCADCHKKDPHKGQFADGPVIKDCAACHNVDGFKPSTFGIAQHTATRFPLKARHSTVACAKCHVANTDGIVYRIREISCAGCHKDAHGGQFRSTPYDKQCESCHTDHGFRPSTFTRARHSATRYPLLGAHAAVACAECHRQRAGFGPSLPVQFRFEDRTCTACHDDPHQGQFAPRMMAILPDGNAVGCRACHTTKSWQEIQGFDHMATDFPLEGSHRAVLCEQCHKANNLTTAMKGVLYKSTPMKCSSCHDDVHGGQFSSGLTSPECSKCHRVLKWRLSTFDHDIQSDYRLDGAHRDVRCALCHKSTRQIAGRMVVAYKPTPHDCSACHGTVTAGNRP